MRSSETNAGRQRVPDAEHSGQPPQGVGTITLGLVPAPDLPAKLAYKLADELPELLANHIDETVLWEVPVVCDPLTGGEEEAPQILDESQKLRQREGWDIAISITDLPILRSGRVVVANVRVEPGVGGVSLPALGATLLRRRLREAILQLASEIRWGSSPSDRERESRRQEAQGGEDARESAGAEAEAEAGEAHLRGSGARQLVGRRLTERLAPIQRVMPPGEETDVDVRYVAPRVRGRGRLLAGMVLANNPWALFATLKGSLVAAFATGAYALIFSSVRVLSDTFGSPRLIAFMVLSMAAIVFWLVLAYGLWERPSRHKSRRLSQLYNIVTALTLIVAVLSFYAALFVLALLAAMFLVPAELFQMTIGRPPGIGDYLSLALVVASLSTIAGSLGLGAEDKETVLRATYGYRQRRRSEKGKKGERAREEEEAHHRDGGSSPESPEPWRIHRKGRD